MFDYFFKLSKDTPKRGALSKIYAYI